MAFWKGWLMNGEAQAREIRDIGAKLEALRGHSWYSIALGVRKAITSAARKTGLSPARVLEELAPSVSVGVNTLRRYLAISEFAEQSILGAAGGAGDLSFVEANFTGLETISRLNRIDPSQTKDCIEDLKSGAVTTRQLRAALEAARYRDSSSSTARRGQATARTLESRKGLQEAVLLHSKRILNRGGHLYRGTSVRYVKAAWFATASDRNELGYFIASAASNQSIEESVFSAVFGSIFFVRSWLVVPAPKEALAHVMELLDTGGLELGLIAYDQKIIEIRMPAPRYARAINILGLEIGSW
ncbi:hypothetical protein V1281_004739 [Nitrobacteraceae bacterium AZCC 2161]